MPGRTGCTPYWEEHSNGVEDCDLSRLRDVVDGGVEHILLARAPAESLMGVARRLSKADSCVTPWNATGHPQSSIPTKHSAIYLCGLYGYSEGP